MTGPRGIAVAPDGRHVYVAAATGSAVVVFTRNLTTGTLAWHSTVTNSSPGVSGMGGARAVAVSPDGRHVVVAGETSNGIAVFARNLATGALTFVEAKLDGANEGLDGASALAFSPAGDALYVAGYEDDAVVVFSRDLTAGQLAPQLSWAEREKDGPGVPVVDGLDGARGVEVSPDGSLVFVAGANDGKIAIFSRNTGGSQVHQLDFLDIAGLASAVDLAITPAGEQVYGVGSTWPTAGHVLGDARRRLCLVPGGSVLTFSDAGGHSGAELRHLHRGGGARERRERHAGQHGDGRRAGRRRHQRRQQQLHRQRSGRQRGRHHRDQDGQSVLGRPRRVGGLHRHGEQRRPGQREQRLGNRLRARQRRLLVGELEPASARAERSADRPPPAPATSTPAT